jgi:hypothetical protein
MGYVGRSNFGRRAASPVAQVGAARIPTYGALRELAGSQRHRFGQELQRSAPKRVVAAHLVNTTQRRREITWRIVSNPKNADAQRTKDFILKSKCSRAIAPPKPSSSFRLWNIEQQSRLYTDDYHSIVALP